MAETLVNKTQAGEGIWTSDNLVAGSGISIQQIPQPVIDENTLVVAHLDENLQNSAGGSITITSFGNFSTTYHKFGTGSSDITKTSTGKAITSDFSSIIGQGDYTLDFWHLRLNNGDRNSGYVDIGENSKFYFGSGSSSSYNISVYHSSYGSTPVSTSTYGTWNHYAIVRKNGTVAFYINGVKQTQTYSDTSIPGYVYVNSNNYSSDLIDEVRLSNVARWTSDFTPFAQPYEESTSGPTYQINNTQDSLPSQTGNSGKYLTTDGTNASWAAVSGLQNTSTGDGALTIIGTSTSGQYATNIGGSSSSTGQGATAIGSGTVANGQYACAVGFQASAVTGSVCIGGGVGNSYPYASSDYSIAIGCNARIPSSSKYAISIGNGSKATAQSAIQLGSGTNSTASTFQVFNTTVVDASGKVPMASTDITSLTGYDASKTQVLKNVNGTLTWVDEA